MFTTPNIDKRWRKNIKASSDFQNPNFSNLAIPITTAVELNQEIAEA